MGLSAAHAVTKNRIHQRVGILHLTNALYQLDFYIAHGVNLFSHQ